MEQQYNEVTKEYESNPEQINTDAEHHNSQRSWTNIYSPLR